jgi:hypothetical protein
MIDISFDMCGSLGGVSGVIFPALLSEFGIDAGSDRQLLEAITSPPSVWTRYNYSVAAGNNVTGGVSLQFDVVCGAVEGCVAEANFDNVSVTIGGGIAPGEASGNSCIAGDNSGGGGSTGETNVTDFEGAIESYAFGDFAGGAASVIANPDMSGINTSAQVGQMVKFAGEIYGGSTFTLASPVDIPVNAVITMKVWSPRAVAVLFKLEGGPLGEITATHSGSGWEELTFDFTGISGTGNTGVTLIFDNGTAGDAENNAADWTFYFDDMTIPAAASDGGGDDQLTELGFDFEDGVTGTWTVFENDSDPELAFITNPDTSGANTSATVAQFTATQMGQRYAGTETKSAPTFSLDASNSTVRIMVWKSVISQVGIKFARADGGAEFETLVSNTVTNAWEELTFDFSGQVGVGVTTDLTTIIVFPDYYADGSNRAQENIVYFDNITFSAN